MWIDFFKKIEWGFWGYLVVFFFLLPSKVSGVKISKYGLKKTIRKWQKEIQEMVKASESDLIKKEKECVTLLLLLDKLESPNTGDEKKNEVLKKKLQALKQKSFEEIQSLYLIQNFLKKKIGVLSDIEESINLKILNESLVSEKTKIVALIYEIRSTLSLKESEEKPNLENRLTKEERIYLKNLRLLGDLYPIQKKGLKARKRKKGYSGKNLLNWAFFLGFFLFFSKGLGNKEKKEAEENL